MEKLLVLVISYFAFFVAVEQICKVQIIKHIDPLEKDESVKENSGESSKENKGGVLGFLEDLTPIGFGVSASYIAEFLYSVNAGAFGNDFENLSRTSTSDIVMDMLFFAIAQIIGFVIFFYIVYGILSVAKSHNGDERARRNAAAWTTVIIDLFAIVCL